MLYIQQSLNPNEEIVRVGHFHWWYTFNAALWIVIGLIFMIAILYGAYFWNVTQYVQSNFQGLPDHLKSQAWDESVSRQGGMLDIMLSQHIAIKLIAFGAFLICFLVFIQKMVIKATTEICLTSDRLVLKRGLIARQIEEISIDRIEGVDVSQGILGRVLGFGQVAARGMGVGEVMLPPIEEPIDFRKAIDRARGIRRNNDNI